MPTPEELAAAKAAEEAAAAEAARNTPEALKAQIEELTKQAATAKAEAAKLKEGASATEAEKAKQAEAAAKVEQERLRKEGNFQALYEQSEARAKDLATQLKKQAAGYVGTLKLSEVKVKAQAAGILETAIPDLQMVDLSAVMAQQAEDGTISFEGADNFIAKLKADKPHWFGTAKPPKINLGNGNGAGGGSNRNDGRPSPADLLKLQTEGKEEEYQAGMKLYMQG